MTEITKAKINLKEGVIDLEGTETFVSKYLDEFKEKFTNIKIPVTNFSQETVKNQVLTSKITPENKTKKVKKVKKIEIEAFDIDGDVTKNIPSLSEFFKEKNPGKNASKVILTLGYYITSKLNLSEFSEGNIDYGYKALNLTGKPAHLHQIIINQKNEKQWYEEGSDTSKWKLSRIGEIFVEEKLNGKENTE